jgi:D-alanine-D-alanine ligase
MDKDVMKRLLRDAGIPIGDFLTIRKNEPLPDFGLIQETLGLPCFIKPANMGSSVGVHKVTTEEEYHHALQDAFRYDHKVLIETYIQGREIECAVLGNTRLQASRTGEVIPKKDFYSYEAKYVDAEGAAVAIPAEISEEVIERIQELALQTFQTLECQGLGRVDVFLTPTGEIYVNEINTLPGFTDISMYPKLWEVSGLSYQALLEKIISLAME